MVYGIYNYSYWGESKPTNLSWGPHIVGVHIPAPFCSHLGLFSSRKFRDLGPATQPPRPWRPLAPAPRSAEPAADVTVMTSINFPGRCGDHGVPFSM